MLIRITFTGFSAARRRLLSLFICLLSLFSAQLQADDWYQVEVVLFGFTEPDAGAEWWYENPGLPARAQTIGLITETAEPLAAEAPEAGAEAAAEAEAATEAAAESELTPYLALPRQDHRLSGVRRALARSKDYRPLLHVAWQQPGLDRRDVRAVRLDNTHFDTGPAEQAEPEPGAAGEQPDYTPPVKVFDGIIRLRKSRFLHLDVDFAYFPETLEQPDLELPEPAGGYGRLSADYVRLTQSRRVRPDELHYFDHPLFGLIIQVSRMEIPPAESVVPGQ